MASRILNSVLFPAPKPPHYTHESHAEDLFWLPAQLPNDAPIPCMFYSPSNAQKKKIEYLMIFCHGNGCDIGSMQYTLNAFAGRLNIYIISFEYPSYGLCTAPSPNQDTINKHADRTFDFVRDTLRWPTERILIYGHSIGSGAACYLASTRSIAALILQSPYTAIRNLVREKAGIFSYLIGSRSWDNLDAMQKIHCPVLFIHGQDDTLIPSNHSRVLYDACSKTKGSDIQILPHEDHNSMSEDTLVDLIRPFLKEQSAQLDLNLPLPRVRIDDALRVQPSPAPKTKSNNGILNSLIAVSKASTAATRSAFNRISGPRTNESDETEQ